MRKRLVAAAISFLAGTWGAHHFYLGNAGKGILSILFSWTGIPTIIGIIGSIRLIIMSNEEFDRKYNFEEYKREKEYNTLHRDVASEIAKLAELMEKGYITFEEFERRKTKLLR